MQWLDFVARKRPQHSEPPPDLLVRWYSIGSLSKVEECSRIPIGWALEVRAIAARGIYESLTIHCLASVTKLFHYIINLLQKW